MLSVAPRFVPAIAMKSNDLYTTRNTAWKQLVLDNEAQGPIHRCTGRIMENGGKLYFTDCKRYQCHKHGKKRLAKERGCLVAGAQHLFDTGDLYFGTITWADASKDTSGVESKTEFAEATRQLLDRLRNKARNSGIDLIYALVYGPKDVSGQFHAHILLNWLPEPCPTPDKNYPDRISDPWLDARARKLDLALWFRPVYAPVGIVNYLIKNVKPFQELSCQRASTALCTLPTGSTHLRLQLMKKRSHLLSIHTN